MASTRLYALYEGVTIAFDAIRSNRVRAGLTILGVAVGVFVVVVISAAIHGINTSVAKDIESAGPTSFFVSRFPIAFTCDGTDEVCPWRRNPPITVEEITALGRLPSVQAVSAAISGQGEVSYRGRALPGPQIRGQLPSWTAVDGGDIPEGRNFTESENRGAARVVIVNGKMAESLFGELDPIRKNISIAGQPFEIIGLYSNKASFLSGGDSPMAIVPFETARRYLGGNSDWVDVTVKPLPSVARDDAVDDVTAALRTARGLKPATDNNFAIITQDKLLETYNKIFGMFFLVMIVLSAIGLLVGGVGVVAIMMISVTERTREIGVRKALGATRGTILWQFLVEAVTLTATGAMIGLIGGWLVAMFIGSVSPIKASVPPGAILAALVASAVTGVAFGMLPAARAARLDPVEALRYE